jgi:DDE superfamily endonuclease
MVRLYGRGPRGERVIDDVPQGTWKTVTFVAALRHNKMVAPMVFDGTMTGQIFVAYVEQCLAPTLKRNDIVVIDIFELTKWPASARRSKPRAQPIAICPVFPRP